MKWNKGRTINRLALPITRRCNRVCPDCPTRGAEIVPVDELKWVGKTLGPIGKIEVTGGEPSLHPDFVEISENIHAWFQCKDIMLLTNGWRFRAGEFLYLLLNYDMVYVTHYTPAFAEKYGTPTNTKEHDIIKDYLSGHPGVRFWSQVMDRHDPIGHPPYKGVCPPHCQYDKGDMIGYNRGQLYGCCTAYCLPSRGRGILLTDDWRDHLEEIELPCEHCFLTGMKDGT